jgi:integrase
MTAMLADNSLRRLMRKLKQEGTPHGFRATFRTWVSDKTSITHELGEIALSHLVGTRPRMPTCVATSWKNAAR